MRKIKVEMMKHTLLYIGMALAFFAMQPDAALAKTKKPAKVEKQLVVLHTNDTHSCVMPINPNLADTAMANRGGFLRRVAMIQEERKENPDLLLFDSGDFSQGSPYYSLFKGDVEVGLMNEMKYDAATIGNHEFDFGIDNMVRIFKMAKFPIVCSNYDFTGTPLADIVKPYTIIYRKGVKIGVFGLGPELKGLVTEANYGSIKYEDPIAKANEMTEILKKKEKCDVIICISHLGWDIDGIDDTEMVSGTRDIDLVLGGHSHTYFKQLQYRKNLDGREVPVDQNGKSAIWVGKMILKLVKNTSKK
jgi:5'-nucleotidase